MKKLITSCIIAISLTGCTVAEFREFVKPTNSESQSTVKSSKKQTVATDKVIRIKKNPNEGKKRVSVGGVKMPSQFSYDEDGEVQFTPKTTDRDIREYNRILQRAGVKVEGY